MIEPAKRSNNGKWYLGKMAVLVYTWEGGGGRGAGEGPGAQPGREIYDPEDKLIVEMMWP